MVEFDSKKELDELSRRCGEIIFEATSIESSLEFLLENYFVHISEPHYKRQLFYDNVLTEITFAKKIALFKSLFDFELIDEKKLNNILESLSFVQRLRNRAAHDMVYMDHKERRVWLQKRKSITYVKDDLEISDKDIQDLKEKTLSLRLEFSRLNQELSDSNRKLRENCYS